MNYTPPSDFHLPSPPYYRPASSVSLTCVAPTDAVGDISYLWFSTNTDSFVNGASEETVSQDILTAFDAGYHTCTVTDEVGNTGCAHTTMKLFGKLILRTRMHYALFVLSTGAGIYKGYSALGNNTSLRRDYHELYCLSNSTTTEHRPSIWYPRGRIYPNQTINGITISEYSTGISVNTDWLYEEGVYICDIADSNGYTIHLSFGLYSNYPSKL